MINDRDSRMLHHNKKLNRLLDTQLKPTAWIPDLQLTSIEKSFITDNQYLCDRVIDAAMQLLQATSNLLIQSATLPHSLLIYSVNPTIHIYHINGNHFVTSTSLGDPSLVTIYDSANSSKLDPELEKQITTIYSTDSTVPTVRQAQITNRQQGGLDCGLFSIAYAIELASGNYPTEYLFDQSAMRQNLISCLEKRKREPFPKKWISSTLRHEINTA